MQHKPGADWAVRLIPGVATESGAGVRKRPRPASCDFEFPAENVLRASVQADKETVSETALALLLPDRLKRGCFGNWLKAVAVDFVLVGMNWLFVGALILGLQNEFPQIRGLAEPAGYAVSVLGIALLHAVLITLLGYSEGLYAITGGLDRQARALGKAVLWATLLLCVAYNLQGSTRTFSVAVWGSGLLHFGALLAWRWEEQRRTRPTGQLASDARNVLIVGAGGVGRRVASYLESHPEEKRVVCGFLDDERPLGNGVIGRVSNLERLARTGFVDEVILAAPHGANLTLRVLHEARRLRLDVQLVPDLFGCKPAWNQVERVGDLPLICLREEHLPAPGLLAKRLVDIVGAGLVLLASAPVLAVIAALIKLDSRGPVLYAAQRAGLKGRPFRCYKFRTMVSNADALKNSLRDRNQRSGPFFKMAHDPRVTRLGYFLRRYSLDELPQLWNVLKAEMSLVGPRPHPLDDFAAYEIDHLARLDVTPGITGLWQVMARRDPSFQKGIEMDRQYIRTWSLGMDLRILFKTVMAVVEGSGQ